MSLFSKLFSSKKSKDSNEEPEEPKFDSSIDLSFSVADDGKKQLTPANPDYLLGENETRRDEVLMIEQGGFNVKELTGTSTGRRYEIPSYKLPGFDLFDNPGQLQDGYIHLTELLASEIYQNSEYALPCVVGKTEEGEICCFDLIRMPNVLIAGSMGTGKSTLCHTMIISLLLKRLPEDLKLVLVDLKGLEFNYYNRIDKHYLAKIPDIKDAVLTNEKEVVRTLNALVIELDERVNLLKEAGCRNVIEYNEKQKARQLRPTDGHRYLPYLVVVIDDYALLVSSMGKEASLPLLRILEAGKAVGIHAIVGTSRLSTDVFSSQMKACIPARISFRVNTASESRALIDAVGANLLGECGEMMALLPGRAATKANGAIVTSSEIDALTSFVGSQKGYYESYVLRDLEYNELFNTEDEDVIDSLFEEAARIVVQTQQGSTSMIQRKLKLGYNRAGHIIDQLEAAGIVGPFTGSKSREVKVSSEYALEQILSDLRNMRGSKTK